MAFGENRVTFCPGVVLEKAGNELLVKAPGSIDVMMLSGEAAAIVRRVEAGQAVAWSADVAELMRRGVLAESPGLSRRGFIRAGAVGAGAGIVVLSMPGVAQAASEAEVEVVALTFGAAQVGADGTRAGRYLVTLPVFFPVGFVAPLADPIPVSAVIGTDQVAAEFVSLAGNDRNDWYDTRKPVHIVKWNVSTAFSNGQGWPQRIDGEVVFRWGLTRYPATGTIPGSLSLPPPQS